MSGKMRWHLAAHAGKRPVSLQDEQEFEGKDRASKWLEKHATEKKPKARFSKKQLDKPESG